MRAKINLHFFQITRRFPIPSAGELSRPDNDDRLRRDFEPLVDVLVDKYKRRVIPDDIDELHRQFKLTFPASASVGEGDGGGRAPGFADPKDTKEIRCSVLNTLITSSLSSASDKTSYAYQLFQIYKQYPDSLLRSVMSRLKRNKMVSPIIFGRSKLPL
jgi:hypothetical protein